MPMPLRHLPPALILAILSACAAPQPTSPTALMQQNSERAERALQQERPYPARQSDPALAPTAPMTPEQFFCHPDAQGGYDSPSCAKATRHGSALAEERSVRQKRD